jgi:hypothetical protein
MPTPSSGVITFTDVASTQLGQSTPYSMSGMYNTANTGGNSGLMYHNLNMATGNATTAKNAIWDNYNAGTNEALSNWYNYDQNIGLVITFLITNSSAYNVNFNLAIWNSTNANVGTIYNTPTINSGTNTGTQTVQTGCLSSTVTAGYRIAIQDITFSPGPPPINPPPPIRPSVTYTVNVTVNSASDTDGVGAGTTRTTYGPWTYSETQNQPPAPSPPTPWNPVVAADSGGSTIYNNKRTTISITIS